MEKGIAIEEGQPPDPPQSCHTMAAYLVAGARAGCAGMGAGSGLPASRAGLTAVQGAGSEGSTSGFGLGRREQGLAAGRSGLGGSSGVAGAESQESRSRSGSNQPEALFIEHPSHIKPPVKAKGNKKVNPTKKKQGLGSKNVTTTNMPLDSLSMGIKKQKNTTT